MNEKRKADLLDVASNAVNESKVMLTPIIDEIIFLEDQLDKLRSLPFIKFNPQNKYQQKATPAQKQYKELLQQYINCIKAFSGIVGGKDIEELSPMDEYFEKLNRGQI